MVIVLFLTFRLQSYIVEFAYEIRHESSKTKEALVLIEALAMSLVVVVVNALLRIMVMIVVI
jgi:hypothetical protein